MHIQPQSARFHSETTIEGLKVVIPASRNWFNMLFVLVWLGGWAIGETRVVGQLLNGGSNTQTSFLFFWLAGWTLGGLYAFSSVLWQLAGREILTANSLALVHRIEILGMGVNRSYGASDIKNLRITRYAVSPTLSRRVMLPPFFGSRYGLIAFDYGARTIRIGSSLEEAEASSLLSSLASRLGRNLAPDSRLFYP